MPTSITKTAVSHDIINKLVQNAFGREPLSVTELTEGFFNLAYKIEFPDSAAVLKIAPPSQTAIMTHEINIMRSEVEAMKMVASLTSVPVPRIIYYDAGKKLLDREYFFMELLEGRALSNFEAELSDWERSAIQFKTGEYTKMINSITNTRFGYYAQTERYRDSWFDMFSDMISDTFSDARRKSVKMAVDEAAVLRLLKSERDIFDLVLTPRLVHWDIWAGNIFVKDSVITGIIDFERCLWGDPLLEVGFRTTHCEPPFLDGYGIKALSDVEYRRAWWYDIYLYLISSLEYSYRCYDNNGSYVWASDMLRSVLPKETHI